MLTIIYNNNLQHCFISLQLRKKINCFKNWFLDNNFKYFRHKVHYMHFTVLHLRLHNAMCATITFSTRNSRGTILHRQNLHLEPVFLSSFLGVNVSRRRNTKSNFSQTNNGKTYEFALLKLVHGKTFNTKLIVYTLVYTFLTAYKIR